MDIKQKKGYLEWGTVLNIKHVRKRYCSGNYTNFLSNISGKKYYTGNYAESASNTSEEGTAQETAQNQHQTCQKKYCTRELRKINIQHVRKKVLHGKLRKIDIKHVIKRYCTGNSAKSTSNMSEKGFAALKKLQRMNTTGMLPRLPLFVCVVFRWLDLSG